MLTLNLFFVTVTVSTRTPDPSRIAKRYEDDLRIHQVLEDTRTKWDREFYWRY